MSRRSRIALTALVGCWLIPAGIAASELGEDRHGVESEEQIVIITGDGEKISLSLQDGPRVRVVSDGEEDEVIEIDLSGIGEIIRDAMTSVDDALKELADVQIDMRLGRKNSLTIFDGEDEVMVDVGQIMADVGQALQESFEEVGREFGHSDDGYRRHRHGRAESEPTADDEERLQRQLRTLRDEIADLKAELRRLERRQRH